jgi:hypothetical protein
MWLTFDPTEGKKAAEVGSSLGGLTFSGGLLLVIAILSESLRSKFNSSQRLLVADRLSSSFKCLLHVSSLYCSISLLLKSGAVLLNELQIQSQFSVSEGKFLLKVVWMPNVEHYIILHFTFNLGNIL